MRSAASVFMLICSVLGFAPSAVGRTDEPALDRAPELRDAEAAGVGRIVANLRATNLDGGSVTLDQLLEGRRGLVVAMTSAECPIARKYAPRLAALESSFEKVAFLYV